MATAEKEYIERVDLIKFVKKNTPNINGNTTMRSVERVMKAAPAAADVVEVVRCEKCIFSGECTESEKLLYLPETVICERIKGRNPKFKDDFCSDGKRKEQT